MRLPHSIRVILAPATGAPADLSGMLVGLDLLHTGREYYSTLLGLTDSVGVLEIAGEEIERAYREDQRFFPMDYRLGLEAYDAVATIGFAGGDDFRERQAAALVAPLLLPEYRQWWSVARNAEIASAEIQVDLTPPSVEVRLPVRSADRSEGAT